MEGRGPGILSLQAHMVSHSGEAVTPDLCPRPKLLQGTGMVLLEKAIPAVRGLGLDSEAWNWSSAAGGKYTVNVLFSNAYKEQNANT